MNNAATAMQGQDEVLEQLAQILAARREADPGSSYVAGLYAKGLEAILAKVEEEAGEVLDAARTGDDAHLVHEVADLWFHTMVMLIQRDLQPSQVLAELQGRFGISGLEEKASRANG